MTSLIDITKPESVNATTASVRDNFAAAKTEIEALQTDKVDINDALGTPTSGDLSNCTGLPIAGGGTGATTALSARSNLGLAIGSDVQPFDQNLDTWANVTPGAGVADAMAIAIGSPGAPALINGALGTPTSGNLSNCTGTASININGTVGAATPTTGDFTEVDATTGKFTNLITGEWFASYTKEIMTPNGGLQTCRFIEDNLGKWVLVGRFKSNAALEIATTWSTVRGLSTSTTQDTPTAFSADWGNAFPTEVRVMGSTNFNSWRSNRTIDFVYRVPANRQWKTFFNGGNENGTYLTSGGISRYGFNVEGSYDGFGRWNAPTTTQIGMSDFGYVNPSAAYITPSADAITWSIGNDAKLTTKSAELYSGQDDSWTSGFGFDDGYNFFNDEYPNFVGQNTAQSQFSSAVWILLKLN